jgi:hypothetical protein
MAKPYLSAASTFHHFQNECAMNVRTKIQVLNIVLGVALVTVLGLGLSSFFAASKLKKTEDQTLKQNLYLFERSMEDVRTCLDAEEYKLAKIRLAEAIELLKDSQSAAKRNKEAKLSFDAISKKYCRIWNSTEWGYSYRAADYPELQKGFESICK